MFSGLSNGERGATRQKGHRVVIRFFGGCMDTPPTITGATSFRDRYNYTLYIHIFDRNNDLASIGQKLGTR